MIFFASFGGFGAAARDEALLRDRKKAAGRSFRAIQWLPAGRQAGRAQLFTPLLQAAENGLYFV